MGFQIKDSIFNLGETKIDNIFIEEYMPHAPAQYVKIYIIALSKAQNSKERLHIMDVARALETSLLNVLEAFEYWREKNLVEIIEDNGIEKRNIKHCDEIKNHEKVKIIFKNIKDIHIINRMRSKSSDLHMSSDFETPSGLEASSEFEARSNFEATSTFEALSNPHANGGTHRESIRAQKELSDTQRLDSIQQERHVAQELNYEGLTKVLSGDLAGNDQSFTKFIEKLEYMRKGKILSPEAIRRLAFYKNNLGLSVELLELACNLSYDNPNVKEYNYLNYARGILNNFYEANIFTIEEYYRRERQNSYKIPTPEEIEQQQMSKKYNTYTKGNPSKYKDYSGEKSNQSQYMSGKNQYKYNQSKYDYQNKYGSQNRHDNQYKYDNQSKLGNENPNKQKDEKNQNYPQADKINSRMESERLRIREKLR